jgi:hypothetical protein
VTGSGYEDIGRALTDRRLRDVWAGRSGAREVNAEDPRLQREFLICRRPGFARKDSSVKLDLNYFTVRLEAAPSELFKYHVDVERSPDAAADSTYGPASEPRPLPRSLVPRVINAALRQYASEFGDVRFVHDGMAALYSPVKLPWNSKDLINVNVDGMRAAPVPPLHPVSPDGAPRQGFRGPPTFVVKMKLVETISTESLLDYSSNPDVNVMPVLQALDVAARHLAAQRLTPMGRSLFSLKNPVRLEGGKHLCWGYHQSIHVADKKLVMNMDPVATVFYAPGKLMDLVLAALKARTPIDIRGLSDRESKVLARALRKIEVVPTHREDRKRSIYGVSALPADEPIVSIKGEDMSVADYFRKRYTLLLQYPKLPLVNVGSRHVGKETWLPVELCKVAPGQRCTNIDDLDTAEIIRQTCKPPDVRKQIVKEQVRKAALENDPFLAAFGVKVDQRLETTRAGVIAPPEVQYANVSETPSRGQWNLRDKHLVESGAPLLNWGVVILANVREREVQNFVHSLVDMADTSGLVVEDKRPRMIHKDDYRDANVETLMTVCFDKLKACSKWPPQLLMVIKQDRDAASYEEIKRVANEVLGVPSQCIVSQNVPSAKPQYCANVCLKINMKLGGKNSILRESLPLVSTAPTILIGADIDLPRSGVGHSIAGVVGSMDRYSSKYVARVAAQKGSGAISSLPTMLREIFLEFYRRTKRRPEHIVYYRDGVSEGEYFDVLQAEMRSLRQACLMIEDDYLPPVTFIVINRRHHTRAFPSDSRDADRKGNVLPGTVIDSGIVGTHRFEFFLYGHSGIQGTSVPCHYTVLYDENKMPADDVQHLTYHLGYTSGLLHALRVGCCARVLRASGR